MANNRQVIVDRRRFLQFTGATLGGLLLQPSELAFASAPIGDDIAILYDADKCIGCRACEEACKEYNNLPAEPTVPSDLSAITWNLIKQRKGVGQDDGPFFNYQCMHCTDAACVMVCPTGALFKDGKGFVAFDEDKCNGCGYCTQFCPFGVPHLKGVNLITGEATAAKCTFCQDKVRAGTGGPSCAEACPTGALIWGSHQTLLEGAKARVSELKAQGYSKAMLYGENEAGGLHRLSILLDEPSVYGLPVDPQASITFSSIWQRVIQPLGGVALGAAALCVIMGFFITRRNIRMEEVE
jgi:formate dehydrogenase iron-sulfur subunit